MSEISELAQKIGGLGSKLDEAGADTANATWEAAAAAALAEAIGGGTVADDLNQVREQLEVLAAALRAASDRANAVAALTRSVGKGQRGDGQAWDHLPQASRDPAAIDVIGGGDLDTASGKGSSSVAKRPSARLRKRMARVAEKTEDIADAADQFHEGITSLDAGHVRPPEPPPVTATSTQAPQHPPTVNGVPGPGVEAGTLASAGLAVTVGAVGAATMLKRAARRRREGKDQQDESQ